jgi:hypothetical protein
MMKREMVVTCFSEPFLEGMRKSHVIQDVLLKTGTFEHQNQERILFSSGLEVSMHTLCKNGNGCASFIFW